MSDIVHVIRTGFYCFALSWNACNLQSQLSYTKLLSVRLLGVMITAFMAFIIKGGPLADV